MKVALKTSIMFFTDNKMESKGRGRPHLLQSQAGKADEAKAGHQETHTEQSQS